MGNHYVAYTTTPATRTRLQALARQEGRLLSAQFHHMLARVPMPTKLRYRTAESGPRWSLWLSDDDERRIEGAAKATGGSCSAVVVYVIDHYTSESSCPTS